jgi:APA family basic amino acid/polyamine antiporter
VALVLLALAFVVAAVWLGGSADLGRVWPLERTDPRGFLQAAAFLFFAFAGYARIATLGEEVVDPKRTIPRAILIALGIALVIYTVVAVSVLAGAGASTIANSDAPLVAAVEAGRFVSLTPIVRIGATLASLGALLSLIVGVSRTVFAMAGNGDLPKVLSAVHPRYRIPHRAELAVGAVVTAVALIADLRSAIGFSSFAVLAYYAIANASAWTLAPDERHWPRALAGFGVLGCITLALTLPTSSVVVGAGLLGAGVAARKVRRLMR